MLLVLLTNKLSLAFRKKQHKVDIISEHVILLIAADR